MNTSQFMDKQIMDLSNSQSKNDFIDFMNPQEDHHMGSGGNEEIFPSYDFQHLRPIGASQQSGLDSGNVAGPRVWSSADSKTNTNGIGIRNYSSFDSTEPAKVVLEKDHDADNAALVSEIDRTMKKHADNLLHALEGVSARMSQLESRTRHLENSMDDLKVSVGNNSGSTDGKLRQLENILREVQADVQVIRDKQDILEGQLHVAKLQASKLEQQSEIPNTMQSDSFQQAASAPQQSHQHLSPPAIIQPPPPLSLPNTPPPASQQFLPPPVQLPNQFPPNQIPSVPQREPYFPPSQTQDSMNQQYHLPPPQQQVQPPVPPQPQQTRDATNQPYHLPPPQQQLQPPVPPPPPQQQFQPPPPPQYSQPPPPPPPQHPSSLSAVTPQHQPALGHHLDEAQPYAPPQNYPPSLSQPSHPPPNGNPLSQQFYGAPHHMYEPPPSNRPNSGYSTSYGLSSGTSNDPYPYSGSTSQYGGGGPPSPYGGGSMKQQQLPTARILPQALPTASAVSGGSGSAATGNRVPIDDVVDKVTTMGFSRDQVRATVRKLTENGQSVDLNVVLDKLMNDGEGQPQRAWFGR